MRPRLALLALLAPAVLLAAPDPEVEATDRAHEALAEGHPERAAATLRAALGKVSEDAARARLRCLLGAAWLDAGQPARAEAVLAEVPLEAPCGPRAAFVRADALVALERPAEAAEIYEAVGGPRLGEDRDAEGAEAVARIARRLLDDPDRGRAQGLQILASTLDLRIGPERRRALARELADTVLDGTGTSRHGPACQPLIAALAERDDRDDRVRAAAVCSSSDAWPLLSTLGDDAEVLVARARHADPGGADVLWSRALPETRDTLAEARAHQGRLDALPLLEASAEPDALRTRAALLARAGREAEAVALLDQHRERFPADPHRAEVHTERGRLGLALARRAMAGGRPAEALPHYDDFLSRHADAGDAAVAAWEAGVAAREAGDAEDARQRWEELLARWPYTEGSRRAMTALARQLAVDEANPDAAFDLLRRLATRDGTASVVMAELKARDVWIDGGDRVARDPVVRVGARNLEEVELELHRIDAEAFVRAGGTIAGLRDLDVAVVAPDRAWTVPVPDSRPHADIAFDVPVDVPGPGLYAVTASSGEEEAKALILVSDLVVVGRAVGPDLAVATFLADGRPAAGSRIVAVTGGTVIDGRTDASGLWTTELPPSGEVVLLALRDGAPALLELPRSPASEVTVGLSVRTEVERPVVLPGDTVGVRSVVHRDGEPVTGDWTVWLETGGTAMTALQATSDAEGRMVLGLPVPPVSGDRHWEIRAVPPGDAVPITLGSIRSTPAGTAARTLAVRMDGTAAVVEVREADGRPATGVPIAWGDEQVGTTDATGHLRVEGPAQGIPWTIAARIPGTSLTARASRSWDRPPPLELRIEQDRLRPGEVPRVRLVGGGRARIELAHLIEAPEAPAPVPDPWVPALEPGPTGARTWSGAAPPRPGGVEDVVGTSEVEATQDGAVLDLGSLQPGRWRIRAADLDGEARTAILELLVDAGATRLLGARDTALGQTLALGAEGGPALVTAEGDRLLWAAVTRSSRTERVDVTPEWGERAVLAATTPEGDVHAREVEVDPGLRVALETEPRADGTVAVRATVTDGAGRPARAQVALAGWDLRLEQVAGRAPALGIGPLVVPVPAIPPVGGVARAWHDADEGTPISGALRAEAARLREREKAKRAGSGLLSDNNLARAMLGDVPVPEMMGYGGLGAMGSGMGGGGMASGVAGGVVGGRLGGVADVALPGARERALWHVAETDRDGVVSAVLAGPAARWRVRASAVAGLAVGADEAVVRSDERLWVSVHAPDPGYGGDRAVPWASVVNGTEEAVEGELRIGDEVVPIALEAGEVATATVGEARAPGPEVLDVVAQAGGQSASATWAFPLASGGPTPDGPIATVSVGAGAIALAEPDPALRGRAALAAGDPRLERVIRDVRDTLRLEADTSTPARAATLLMLLAELADSGIVPVTRAEIEEAAARLPAPTSPAIGLWVALARARADLPVDPDLLVLLREAELDDAQRDLLDRVLVALGERRDEPDPEALLTAGPPPIGDPLRPDWLRAVAGRLGRARGVATVRVDGRVAGTIDLERGGSLRVLADGAVTVDAPSVIDRSGPPATGDRAVTGARVPRSATGRPLGVRSGREDGCSPCRIAVGEALDIPATGGRFEARAPGRFVLRPGAVQRELAAPLEVEVVDGPVDTPLAPEVALARAEERLAAHLDPEVPALTEPPSLVRWAARIAFAHALRGSDDAEIARRFRTLATVQRDANVDLPEVARAARALAAIGDPEAATRVWRAGLDAAFTAEAAALRALEGQTGTLAAAKLVRDAALRYPDGPAVGEALYLLPAQLRAMAEGGVPSEVLAAGITAMDLRLQAAAWDREFLALNRDHARAPAAGLRLARSLLALGAPEPAAHWARAVAGAHLEDPLLDSLVYLEALARTEAGQGGAERLLWRLVHEPFPDPRGVPGPSVHRSEARLVLGRLHEARGDLQRALAAYDAVAGELPEARRTVDALREERLELPPLVQLSPGEAAAVDIVAQGVETVQLRAYAVDLRTVFLRDGGLTGVRDVPVAGVSPAWSGQRRLAAGPFPEDRTLDLPLAGSGAWLVQVEGDGPRAATLVVRSELELATTDVGGVRRVTVRRHGLPAPGVEVRALQGAEAYAVTTDVRGVAEVPAGAPVLVWDGADVAFTDPALVASSTGSAPPRGSSSLLQGLDDRLGTQQQADESAYRSRFDASQPAAMSLDSL